VPPKGRESITATLHPAEWHYQATVDAAAPVPITIRSKVFAPDINIIKYYRI